MRLGARVGAEVRLEAGLEASLEAEEGVGLFEEGCPHQKQAVIHPPQVMVKL